MALQLFSSPHPKLTNAHNICTKLQPVRVQAVHAHSLWCNPLAATTVSTSNNKFIRNIECRRLQIILYSMKSADYMDRQQIIIFTFIWQAWELCTARELCTWGDPKSSQKAWLSVVLSVVPVLVAVNSHESLMALDMFDSDLWVVILLPHYLIITSKPTDNSGIILYSLTYKLLFSE